MTMGMHPMTECVGVDGAVPGPAISGSRSVAKRPPPRTVSSAAITSIVTDRLCGSIPITTGVVVVLIPAAQAMREPHDGREQPM